VRCGRRRRGECGGLLVVPLGYGTALPRSELDADDDDEDSTPLRATPCAHSVCALSVRPHTRVSESHASHRNSGFSAASYQARSMVPSSGTRRDAMITTECSAPASRNLFVAKYSAGPGMSTATSVVRRSAGSPGARTANGLNWKDVVGDVCSMRGCGVALVDSSSARTIVVLPAHP
jgi:hypothetical protein